MHRFLILLLVSVMIGCRPSEGVPPVAPSLPPPPGPTVSLPTADIQTVAPTPTDAPIYTDILPMSTQTTRPTHTPSTALIPPATISPQGLAVLALINQWRVEIDLWPLAPNPDLSALAQGQADYLATLDAWPDNIHLDAQGRLSDGRARDAGWPAYDDNGQAVAVTEIISSGETPADAIAWWRDSEIHSWVISQAYYREAGVGTIERAWGTTYVVVVGARPNVLPAQYDPVRNDLYLSNELFSGGYDGILWNADRVRIKGEWQPFQRVIPLDERPPAVTYADGTVEVTSPPAGTAWLPHVVEALTP